VLYAVDQDGTFLDVGCANGFLMECLPTWGEAHGFDLEPYGLEIVPEIADLARQRLPHWSERIWTGNVMHWEPPQRFTYVRVGLEYVLPWRRLELILRLVSHFVAPGGRLILGPMSEPTDQRLMQTFLNANGLIVAGVNERPHKNAAYIYRTYWLDC
jgi:SAM-dependent methyltransferase